jgi:hypothetical protein
MDAAQKTNTVVRRETANKTPFDDRVNYFAEVTDINYTLVKEYLKEIDSALYAEADKMDFVDLCRDMNLVSVLPEYVKPKNVALMFLNSEPQISEPTHRRVPERTAPDRGTEHRVQEDSGCLAEERFPFAGIRDR